jgi:fumarylacetoacetase
MAELLPYLVDKDLSAYNIDLQGHARAGDGEWVTFSKTNMMHLYYSAAQCVTHHACTGCNMNPGDMLGTGTISAPEESGYGALVEMN